MTKLFKFISFLILSFALGYSQGWWRSYEKKTAQQPFVILTLEDYKEHPLLQDILLEKLEKVIPYKIVIEKLPNIETLKQRLSDRPIKTHLIFIERKDLFQLESYFDNFNDFPPSLIDQLSDDFILEPKGKYFPILWQDKICNSDTISKDLKIWGFVLPRISQRAHKKSIMFLSDLIHNPISKKILILTQYKLTLQQTDSTDSSLSETLRDSLFFN